MDWKKFWILMPFFLFFGIVLILIVPADFKFSGLIIGLLFLGTYTTWMRLDKN